MALHCSLIRTLFYRVSSYLFFDAQVQSILLLPSGLALKHASTDLKAFARLLHEFSAGSGS